MAKVFLAVPTYNGEISDLTTYGIMQCTERHVIELGIGRSSVLPHGFNALWANGIVRECDYFVMLHADIGPSGLWLDTLIEDLIEHEADLVSAVVPIKTAERVYSTCLAHLGQMAHYRLTVDDMLQLPDVFDTRDVQRVTGQKGLLCVNTGCWVARLKQPWNKEVCFTQKCWITWTADGPTCSYIPEDWDFSQQLHARGCKVLATQRVSVVHRGTHEWKGIPHGARGQDLEQRTTPAIA